MIKQVRENIYSIRVPSGKPLTPDISIYFVKGSRRSLMIDTGLPVPEFEAAVEEALGELGIRCADLDVFLTHMHTDHIGQAPFLQKKGARIFMNEEEYRTLLSHVFIRLSNQESIGETLRLFGVTPGRDPEFFRRTKNFYDGFRYMIGPDFSFPHEDVRPGQRFEYGGLRLAALPLRGHTEYGMGLADEEKQIFFCGDHIIGGIVPGMASVDFDARLLSGYLESLKYLRQRTADWTLYPGHGDPLEGNSEIIINKIEKAFYSRYNDYIRILREHAGKEMTILEIGREIYGAPVGEDPTAECYYVLPLIWTKIGHYLEYAAENRLCRKTERDGSLCYSWRTADKRPAGARKGSKNGTETAETAAAGILV